MTSHAKAPEKESLNDAGSFHKNMRVLDIITLCPETESVIAEYGLHCFNCDANAFETLSDGCKTHGMSDEEIDALVIDLNDLVKALPDRSHILIITETAAKNFRNIAEAEGRLSEYLEVIVDGNGGFCLEFRTDTTNDHQLFTHENVLNVRILASSLTLKRIGGATIDFRDERFKLDLIEDQNKKEECACGGSCGCNEESRIENRGQCNF